MTKKGSGKPFMALRILGFRVSVIENWHSRVNQVGGFILVYMRETRSEFVVGKVAVTYWPGLLMATPQRVADIPYCRCFDGGFH